MPDPTELPEAPAACGRAYPHDPHTFGEHHEGQCAGWRDEAVLDELCREPSKVPDRLTGLDVLAASMDDAPVVDGGDLLDDAALRRRLSMIEFGRDYQRHRAEQAEQLADTLLDASALLAGVVNQSDRRWLAWRNAVVRAAALREDRNEQAAVAAELREKLAAAGRRVATPGRSADEVLEATHAAVADHLPPLTRAAYIAADITNAVERRVVRPLLTRIAELEAFPLDHDAMRRAATEQHQRAERAEAIMADSIETVGRLERDVAERDATIDRVARERQDLRRLYDQAVKHGEENDATIAELREAANSIADSLLAAERERDEAVRKMRCTTLDVMQAKQDREAVARVRELANRRDMIQDRDLHAALDGTDGGHAFEQDPDEDHHGDRCRCGQSSGHPSHIVGTDGS